MSELSKCRKSPSGNIITCEARLAYAFGLLKPSIPKGESDVSKSKYQITLVFPVGSDLTLLNDAIEAVAVVKFGPDYKKKFKVRKPFLKVEDFENMGFDPAQYETFVRASSLDKPQIVDADMRVVGEDRSDAVYSGRWAAASLRPYTYDHPTGGKGVSLGLQNVQLLRDDEPVGVVRAAASDEFSAVTLVPGQSADELFKSDPAFQ